MKTNTYRITRTPVATRIFPVRVEHIVSTMTGRGVVADSEYIFGISEIDSQHEEIETIMAVLLEAINNKNRWPVIQAVLESLYEKLTAHFTLEEAVMNMFSLQETQEHSQSHREILEFLESCINRTPSSSETKNITKQAVQLVYEQIHTHDLKFVANINLLRSQTAI
jgi:hemerythrin-like metal-binding protein